MDSPRSTISEGGRDTRVLFDAGRTPDGLLHNMRRLGISPGLIHPDFWSRRRVALPGREPVELPSTSKSALQGAGFEIVEEREPSFLLGGSLLVTGEVDRTTEFERGVPGHEAHRQGDWRPDP